MASAATHAVLPLIATVAGPPPADRRRAALAPPPLRPAAPASGFPSARTSPGSSGCSPSAGLGFFCVDQSAHEARLDALAPGRDPRSGPVAFAIDWQAVSLALVAGRLPGRPASTPTSTAVAARDQAWAIGGGPYDPEAARGARPRQAAEFVAAVAARLERVRGRRGRPGLVVFAIDTELLGDWWCGGPGLAGAVLGSRGEHGVSW